MHQAPDLLTWWSRDESSSLSSRDSLSGGEMGKEPDKDSAAVVPTVMCADHGRHESWFQAARRWLLTFNILFQISSYASILTCEKMRS